MRRNANRLHVGYSFVLVLLAVCMLFLGVFIGSRRVAQVEAMGNTTDREKFYTSIIVEKGDTLWSIADEYMSDEYEDRDSFMDEVREMNHLTGSIIHVDSTLLIPYYADAN